MFLTHYGQAKKWNGGGGGVEAWTMALGLENRGIVFNHGVFLCVILVRCLFRYEMKTLCQHGPCLWRYELYSKSDMWKQGYERTVLTSLHETGMILRTGIHYSYRDELSPIWLELYLCGSDATLWHESHRVATEMNSLWYLYKFSLPASMYFVEY